MLTRCSRTSALASWPRVTDANRSLIAQLVEDGLDAHEARWLVQEFGGENTEAVLVAAQRRLNGEPIQYVIGHWPFRSLDLDVDSRVLIPRPESEELVGVVLNELAKSRVEAPLIMDMGCGSGAIGLALLSELSERGVHATLVAVDESQDALDLARHNALKHRVLAASFVVSSWYENLDQSLRGRVDLIVANPPYVGGEEFTSLEPVLRYEPHGAIVAPDSQGVVGFEDLQTVIGVAPQWLGPRGVLVCEHGNMHREAVLDAATRAGFTNCEDLNDMAGHPRILVASRS
jgi:release factor glutamine methyltransferase